METILHYLPEAAFFAAALFIGKAIAAAHIAASIGEVGARRRNQRGSR